MAFPGLRTQWEHPSGIFSVLLIVRGDVIQKALAQLAGGPFHITPVAFSFGWVSYGVTTLLSSLGEGRMMPEVDCASMLINAETGHRRTNMSWVLGRLLRDWEMRSSYDYVRPALVVTIFKTPGTLLRSGRKGVVLKREGSDLEGNRQPSGMQTQKQAGIPNLDKMWYTGILVMLFQCIVAAVAVIKDGNWLILIITIGGTLLALAGGALPQWREEKWACRRLSDVHDASTAVRPKTVVLTRGNGHRHVIIIVDGQGTGLNLEDLAAGRVTKQRSTLPIVLLLAVSWTFLLLMVGNLSENAWHLLAIGSLGMAQNLFTAGHHRDAGALGFHFDEPEYVLPDAPQMDEKGKEKGNKVFRVIQKTEERMAEAYGVKRVGILLLPIFFPNGLRPHEVDWQEKLDAHYEDEDREISKEAQG